MGEKKLISIDKVYETFLSTKPQQSRHPIPVHTLVDTLPTLIGTDGFGSNY